MLHIVYVSVNRGSIGSDNGLSPIQRQAIISPNARLLSIGPIGTNFSEIVIKIQNSFIYENAAENIVYEMAAILYRGAELMAVYLAQS